MNFLKSVHSLIFKMLKNAGKSWKILCTLIIPRALNFSAFFRDLLQGRFAGFSVLSCTGFSNSFSWASSLSYLSCSRFVFGFIGWTRVSHGCWANGLCLSCRRRRRSCCSKIESESPESYLDGRGDRCFFLSLMQGDETTIGYFNRMKLKRCRGRRPWRKPPGSWEQRASAWQQWTAAVSSPFFTMVIRDEWPVSFDYAIIIHSIHSMLKNSIHPIQKLMNGPTVNAEYFVRIIFTCWGPPTSHMHEIFVQPLTCIDTLNWIKF